MKITLQLAKLSLSLNHMFIYYAFQAKIIKIIISLIGKNKMLTLDINLIQHSKKHFKKNQKLKLLLSYFLHPLIKQVLVMNNPHLIFIIIIALNSIIINNNSALLNKIILMPSPSTFVPLNPEIKKTQHTHSERRLVKLERIGFQIEAQKLRKEYSNKNLLKQMKMRSHSTKKTLDQITDNQVGHFLKPTKIISITAHKWVAYDFFSSKYIRGYRAHDSHPLSDFSKLLVFCAVNTLVQKNKIDTSRFQTIATAGVLNLHHQRCKLKVDDIVSLQDLLHLMIMEESQVYESVLAVNVGAFLQKKRKKEYYSVFDANDTHMKEHLKQFYDLVNSYCKLLKLQNIRYVEADPELRKQKNKCSAADVAVLSIQCLKIPLFNQIFKKLSHIVNVKYIDRQGKLTNSIIKIQNKTILNKFIPYSSVCRNWQENSFMDSHCSILYEGKGVEERPIVAVLLGCYGPIDRQKDIQQMIEWYIKLDKDLTNTKLDGIGIGLVKGKSAQRLPSLSQVESISKNLQKKIRGKLVLDNQDELIKKYGQAVKIKSNNIRLKTQF